MDAATAERDLARQLAPLFGAGEAAQMAALVLEHLTGKSRSQRLQSLPLDTAAAEKLQAFTGRLLAHEPVQYVLGESWFYGLKLYVNGHVLIPRPETEELVDWIVKDVRQQGIPVFTKGSAEADATTVLKILDVGTGSGCIALALKRGLPRAEVWGCDVSDEALTVARRSGSELDIRVDFVGLGFLSPAEQKQLPSVDILVSNPPYIPQKEEAEMQPNVVHHEPHTALFVPDDRPLLFYEATAAFGWHRLHPGGSVYLEIHERLGRDVVHLFESAGYSEVTLKKDMQGKDRMVRARRG